MLDILSVLLSAIGILQNVKGKASLKEKVGELKNASEEIARVHDFLSEAKGFHDDFERLSIYVIQPLLANVERDRNDIKRLEKHLKNFFDLEQNTLTNKQTNYKADNLRAPSAINPVKTNINRLTAIYPEFNASIESYLQSSKSLKRISMGKHFGDSLDFELNKIRDQSGRVSFNADQIIFNTVPVVKLLHYELHGAIESLI